MFVFLVNSLHDFMFFDSGASQSFVSQSFSREIVLPIGELECPLRVSIIHEHGVSTSLVYQGCVLEISGFLFQSI